MILEQKNPINQKSFSFLNVTIFWLGFLFCFERNKFSLEIWQLFSSFLLNKFVMRNLSINIIGHQECYSCHTLGVTQENFMYIFIGKSWFSCSSPWGFNILFSRKLTPLPILPKHFSIKCMENIGWNSTKKTIYHLL